MIKLLDSAYKRQAILKNAIDPRRVEEINGENGLYFGAVLDKKVGTYLDGNTVVELDNDYFDIAYLKKSQNEDGTLTVDVECEHVSYRLNEPEYNMDTFAGTGTPAHVLGMILEGTGFTVGTVELTDPVTYSANEKTSRRRLLMEYIVFLGGEFSFNKFEVNILQHRGDTNPKLLAKSKNIKVVSKIFNRRESDSEGNPIVAYECVPILLPNKPFSLGDEVILIQKDLGIQEQLRIVRYSYNPYKMMEAEIELANVVSGLEDDLYRIETRTIIKDKLYYGASIGPENGFKSIRSDKKARAKFNADTLAMQVGDGTGDNWTDAVAFDPVSGKYKFVGAVTIESGSGIGNLDDATADHIQETISRKWAAESGADVTGNNTAADTTNVGGVASNIIANWKFSGKTTIDGGKIETDSVTAIQIYVADLSAISANLGEVTAGSIVGITITGSTFRTAASGKRLQIDSSGLYTYNASDKKDGAVLGATDQFRTLEFFEDDIRRGSITADTGNFKFHIFGDNGYGLLLSGPSIYLNPQGKCYYYDESSDQEVATHGYVSSNFYTKTQLNNGQLDDLYIGTGAGTYGYIDSIHHSSSGIVIRFSDDSNYSIFNVTYNDNRYLKRGDGWSGSFINGDGNTVTVTNGQITNVA